MSIVLMLLACEMFRRCAVNARCCLPGRLAAVFPLAAAAREPGLCPVFSAHQLLAAMPGLGVPARQLCPAVQASARWALPCESPPQWLCRCQRCLPSCRMRRIRQGAILLWLLFSSCTLRYFRRKSSKIPLLFKKFPNKETQQRTNFVHEP